MKGKYITTQILIAARTAGKKYNTSCVGPVSMYNRSWIKAGSSELK